MRTAVSEEIKKIHNWANGYGIYITKEAKKLGWKQKTYVKVSIIKDDDGKEKILIEKAKIQ